MIHEYTMACKMKEHFQSLKHFYFFKGLYKEIDLRLNFQKKTKIYRGENSRIYSIVTIFSLVMI